MALFFSGAIVGALVMYVYQAWQEDKAATNSQAARDGGRGEER
jgi:hypothetical protein